MNWFDNLWSKFESKYCWSEWVYYIDGWLPKVSLSMPIVGYLILFNDESVALIKFNTLAKENIINLGLIANNRLEMIYFAFLFLGVSNFWYRIKRPHQFKFGTDFVQYAKNTFEIFTARNYMEIHAALQQHKSLILNAEYYAIDWDGFQENVNITSGGDWEAAKNKYGNMLRSMLEEYYFFSNTSYRGHLLFCVIFSSIGYALLLIPSVDLLIKVLRATF